MIDRAALLPFTLKSIRDKLHSGLSATSVEVHDNSAQHSSHFTPEIETLPTHITIEVRAPGLSPAKPIDAHRAVYRLLKDELDSGLHAIIIKVLN